MGKFIDLTNKVFNRLTVIEQSGYDKYNRPLWLCKCECGIIKSVPAQGLRQGSSRSCGCLQKDRVRSIMKTHGFHAHPFYSIWEAMKQRCGNPNDKAYKDYGGRGITYDPKWKIFEMFYKDMYSEYKPGLTIDRVDNNQGYSKENCRWITMKEQSRNKRSNNNITIGNETRCIMDWITKYNHKSSTVFGRLSRGWDLITALETPVDIKCWKKSYVKTS